MTAGILSIPAQNYFAAEGLSCSMLNVLIDECPAKFKSLIDSGAHKKTPPLEFGTTFHAFVLEPDTLENAYYVQPDRVYVERARLAKLKSLPITIDGKEVEDSQGRIAVPWNGALTEAKQWAAAHTDRPLIAFADLEHIRGMVASLHANAEFMLYFTGGASEQSLFAEDIKGTIRKGRFDHLKGAGNYILDLKSCVSAHPAKFSKAILDYRYYRKAAYYLNLARLCGLKKEVFAFVAVEKTSPYISTVYQLGERSLMKGELEIEAGLEIYRTCLGSGIWPAYTQLQELDCPEWALKP